MATLATPAPATGPLAVLSQPRALTGIAFVLGLLTIAGAWVSQLVFGLVPCELCLEQRMAYYWGLPVLALLLLFWKRLPRALWLSLMLIGVLVFLWSVYMGVYHAGVEWRFWPGPTACSGTGVEISFNDLQNINQSRVVPCDAVQFRLFGISLAGYNALISLAIVGLLGRALLLRGRASRG